MGIKFLRDRVVRICRNKVSERQVCAHMWGSNFRDTGLCAYVGMQFVRDGVVRTGAFRYTFMLSLQGVIFTELHATYTFFFSFADQGNVYKLDV